MSKEKILKLGTDVEAVKKSLEEVTKKLEEVVEGQKDVQKEAKAASKATEGIGKGVKGIGLAIKGAGIGLALKAFDSLNEIMMGNQFIVDASTTAFNFLRIAFSDFVTFLQEKTGPVIQYFKDMFENPKQTLIDFGNAIVDYVVHGIESLLESVGYLGEALVNLFSGDFEAAFESVSNAGSKLVDAVTGVDDTLKKVGETISETIPKIVDYATKTGKAAKAMTDLNNAAELAEAKNQALIEKYDILAEKQRQIRDDESKTFAERIAANEKLKEILDEQEKAMKANAQARVNQAQQQYDLDKDNIEATKELIAAKGELEGVEATITGMRSEYLSNQISLEKELLDIERSRKEAELEAQNIRNEADNEALLNAEEQLRKQEELSIKQYNSQKALLEEQRNNYVEGTAAYTEFTNELMLLDAERYATAKTYEKELTAVQKEEEEKKKANTLARINAVTSMTDNLFALAKETAEEGSKKAKQIAIAETVWNTAKAIMGMLSAQPAGPWNFAQAAIAASMGALNIKKIMQTDADNAQSASTPTAGGGSALSFQSVATNLQGSQTNQIAEMLNMNNQSPMKAYVVSGDVSSGQALDRRIQANATFR